ncbi:MAG: fused MFS/spermidine synthase [Acidobacteriia bacterium]|nr:fused MFS/spermidine synthase [Terriglobia bacterium]
MEEQEKFQIARLRPLGLPLDLAAMMTLIGFTAIVAQIVLMRELIVFFYGNEISLCLILANWLLWTAAGSSLAGRVAERVRNPRRLVAGLQVAISLAMPLTVLAVRGSKSLLQTIPGELLGPEPMFLTSLGALSFFCLISGCMFAAGSRLSRDAISTSTAAATGSVYLLEAIGSGIGGFAASLVLIEHLGAFQIVFVLALLNLLAACSLLLRRGLVRRVVMAALVGVFGFGLLPFAAPWVEANSLAQLWKGFRLVESRNSRYGNLVIVDTEGTRSLYENGLVVATVPDAEAAEEAVHFALLEHPAPKRLLLIGGGINGSLKQALQHPSLERVDYVELDPAILGLAEQYFAGAWAVARADPRVHVHNLDGRLFLKTASVTFDVIIVDLPDPQTAQLNRFYTLEFFREVKRRLEPGGVFSFQVAAAENYISSDLAAFLRCLAKTLHAVFPEVTAVPGATVHFFAATTPGTLSSRPDVLIERLRARKLRTSYVREYFLPFRMSPDRMLDLEQQITPRFDTPVNRDFAPIAYYFDVALWSSRFRTASRRWFHRLADVPFGALTAGLVITLAALALILLGLVRWRSRGDALASTLGQFRLAAGACVGAMGFTLIALEILLLLGFQALYGYVYQQLAMLIAAFMVGMALGAWLATAKGTRAAAGEAKAEGRGLLPTLRGVVLLQFMAALAPLLLFVLFKAFAGVESNFTTFVVSRIAFPGMAVLCGLLGGYQFPLASRIYFAGKSKRSPGALYGLDLLGACVGAVLLSAYLFPVYGFLRSAILIAVLNLAPAFLAVFPAARKEEPQG